MIRSEKIPIFLEDGLLRSAQARQHNFIRLVCEVLEEAGHSVELGRMRDRATAKDLSLTHMKAPTGKSGLVFRRVYHYPFWQIEQTDKRWEWDVAKEAFDPALVDDAEASRFMRFWRKRLFPGLNASKGEAVYIPLQGKLSEHRSFQSCSPMEMVESTLNATEKPVVIGLHPKEVYAQNELAQLEQLSHARSATKVVMGGMDEHLPSCSCVVTQNSAVAFNGYFFAKPTILFGQIDFHHISTKATSDTVADALVEEELQPNMFENYVWWFWQKSSINAGRPEAKQRIRDRLVRFGWPVG